MKRVLLFMVVAAAIVAACVATASGADVSGQAALGSDVVTVMSVIPGTTSDSVEVTANIGPKLQLTLPDYVTFGNVLPGDTGSTTYPVQVRSTRGYTLSRAYNAVNPLGLAVTGVLDASVVATAGVATYTETAAITVGWAEGLTSVPVTYTVVW